jgi:hypothetical protein
VSTLRTLRQWLLGVLALGLLGSGAELVLIEHYEDYSQLVPLFAVALALGVLAWHVWQRNEASVHALRAAMVLLLVAGALGVGLHFRGAAQFQREIDPAMGGWDLAVRVMRAKAPPVLAPGVMLQLGLLGLAYAYRYRADVAEKDSAHTQRSETR